MSNSDELFAKAVVAFREATGCSETQAKVFILANHAYHKRFTEEIVNRHGPANEFAVREGL